MPMEDEKKSTSEHDWQESGAPLVETDIRNLGDKHKILSPQEAVHAEREALLKKASAFKIWRQDELEDPDRSSGPRIPWQQFLHRLQMMNPKIQAKDGIVYGIPTIALYYPKTETEKINDGTAFEVCITEQQKFHRDHKYAGGFNKQELPFYSHVTLDSSHLPMREVRGVMTVLIMLIRAKVITMEQVKREFGDPANDQRSDRFFEQLPTGGTNGIN